MFFNAELNFKVFANKKKCKLFDRLDVLKIMNVGTIFNFVHDILLEE